MPADLNPLDTSQLIAVFTNMEAFITKKGPEIFWVVRCGHTVSQESELMAFKNSTSVR